MTVFSQIQPITNLHITISFCDFCVLSLYSPLGQIHKEFQFLFPLITQHQFLMKIEVHKINRILPHVILLDVGFVEKVAGGPNYDIQGFEASNVCTEFLNTSLATWNEVSDANSNNGYVSLLNGPISHKIHVSVLVVPQLETWSTSHFR